MLRKIDTAKDDDKNKPAMYSEEAGGLAQYKPASIVQRRGRRAGTIKTCIYCIAKRQEGWHNKNLHLLYSEEAGGLAQ